MSTPPTNYTRKGNFTANQQSNPSVPPSATLLDQELNALKATTDQIIARLGQVQRDDGNVANLTIGPDQLAISVIIGVGTPAAWQANTQYSRLNSIIASNAWWYAAGVNSFTSRATFDATEQLNWTKIIDFTQYNGLPAYTIADALSLLRINATGNALEKRTPAQVWQDILTGTGGRTVVTAVADLGLTIGTNTQAHNARLDDIAGAAWAQGDVAYFNGTNLVRLAAGTANTPLITKGAAANPQWASAVPTITVKTSGSGTYNVPAGCVRLRIRMVGGGGGGGGNGTASQTAGGNGGDTTFSTFTAGHGAGGTAGTAGAIGAGGAGGAASGSPTVGIVGSNGGAPVASGALTANQAGGWGGASPFGGAGAPTIGGGGNAATNSGSGGAGAGGNTSAFGAGGGAAGAFDELIITSPSPSYSYAVGAAGTAGTAGTSGSAGGAGGAGIIIIEEFYA